MDDSLLNPFLEEADEKLREMNDSLLTYEEQQDVDVLNTLFRSAHTLKSSAATMEFDSISQLAHRMEDVFDALREDDLNPDDVLFELLYTGIDTLEDMVEHVRQEREAPDADIDDLLEKLERAGDGEQVESTVSPRSTGGGREEDIQQVRVDVDRVDTLMNAVGELLITQKKLRALSEQHDLSDLKAEIDRLERLSGDIRHEVSRARMVPLSQVFDRFPRAVRDIASESGKEVSLTMEGKDLRMDRSIVQELGEPIIHMLRNAIDHGIEPPEEREDQGKQPEGEIMLRAERSGSEAVISVSDDGSGIDVSAVREMAVDREVVSQEEADQLDPEDVTELLCHPDFSTTEEVTELSGRGVGMSIVKETAKRLHGSYDIETVPGEGTTVQLRLPLSLAVVRCFVVRADNRQFGVPINAVHRCLAMSEITVKQIEQQEVFIHDEEEIPLIRLHGLVGTDTEEPAESEDANVLLVQHGNDRAGVVVDGIVDVQEYISKDIDLVHAPEVAGATIRSDGTPILILEMGELFDQS